MCAKLNLSSVKEKTVYILRSCAYSNEIVLVEHIWLPLRRFGKFEAFLRKELPTLLYPVYEEVCGVVVRRAVDNLSLGQWSAQDAAIFDVNRNAPGMCI